MYVWLPDESGYLFEYEISGKGGSSWRFMRMYRNEYMFEYDSERIVKKIDAIVKEMSTQKFASLLTNANTKAAQYVMAKLAEKGTAFPDGMFEPPIVEEVEDVKESD